MPTVSIDGLRLYYESTGDGDPLILIPGFASGRALWARQVEPLARHFRVITFDPRGIAASGKPEGPQTIALLADDVAALLSRLEIESTHVLGTSFGGFVAQEFALRHPRMVRKLVLCCTSFGGPNHVVPAPEIMKEIVQVRETDDVPEHIYRSHMEAAMAFNAESRLAAIKSPVLVISGDADPIVPEQNSRNLAKKLPNARLQLIAGGGHTFFIEQAEQFNEAVVDFLRN